MAEQKLNAYSGETIYPDGYPNMPHVPDPNGKTPDALKPVDGAWPTEDKPDPLAVAAQDELKACLAKGELPSPDKLLELAAKQLIPGVKAHRPGIYIPYEGESALTAEQEQILTEEMGYDVHIVPKPAALTLPENKAKYFKNAGLEENAASVELLAAFLKSEPEPNYAKFKAFVEAASVEAK